jgi:hypothetical protein
MRLICALLFLAGCFQKPDEHYVGAERAPAIKQLRSMLSELADACAIDDGMENQDFGAPPYVPWTDADGTFVPALPIPKRPNDRTLTLLEKRDAIRTSLKLTQEEIDNLPYELDCLVNGPWECGFMTNHGYVSGCGEPLNPVR